MESPNLQMNQAIDPSGSNDADASNAHARPVRLVVNEGSAPDQH
jgi:hypothetical protein